MRVIASLCILSALVACGSKGNPTKEEFDQVHAQVESNLQLILVNQEAWIRYTATGEPGLAAPYKKAYDSLNQVNEPLMRRMDSLNKELNRH